VPGGVAGGGRQGDRAYQPGAGAASPTQGPAVPCVGLAACHRCDKGCVLYPGISTTLHMFLMKVESIYGLLEAYRPIPMLSDYRNIRYIPQVVSCERHVET
jgi:hypothetical protein